MATFGTLHRKEPCDSVGSSMKCLAACASLQKPQNNQILAPLDPYSWAKENFKTIHLSIQ
jgi:hypothetical protein